MKNLIIYKFISSVSLGKWVNGTFLWKTMELFQVMNIVLGLYIQNGNPIDTYSVMPEVKTAQTNNTLTCCLWRIYHCCFGWYLCCLSSFRGSGIYYYLLLDKSPILQMGGVNTPQGWTAISGGSITGAGGWNTLGGDTGNTNIFSFYRVADGTETGNLFLNIQKL